MRSRFPPSRVWILRLAITIGVIAALIVVAWLAVPPIVRGQIESRLTEGLGRKTTVETADFDPFSLRLTLRKLVIDDPGGPAPLFAVDEIVADMSSVSLWRRAPVLDALKLVRPAVSFSRDRDGRYSVQDLIDKALATPEGPTPAFSLNNIEIEGGSIRFGDGVTSSQHRVENLAIGIPFLSSLTHQVEIRVTPRLEGVFNGSHFAFAGTTTPFAERHDAAIDIDLDALPLKAYVAYLPVKPRIDLAGGTLTTRLKVVFVGGKQDERKLELRGDARVDGLVLARRDGSALVAANRIACALDRIDLLGRDVRIASLVVDAPAVDLKRLRDGTLELAQPLAEVAPSPAVRREAQNPAGAILVAAPAPDKPWSVSVAKATLARGKIVLVDETSTFRSELADVAIDATNLSTRSGEKAHVALSFVSADRIATFKGQADVEPLVPAATGTFELTKFSLGLLYPYYKDALAVDVQKGSFDLAAHFALLADGNVKLSEGAATLTGLALAYPGNRQPFWTFPAVAGTGIDVDVRERSVKVAGMQSRDAIMKISRERDGSIDVARLMRTTEKTGTAAAERTWTLAFGKFMFERAAIDLEDRVPEPAVKVVIRDLAFAAANFSNARGAKSTTTAHARVGDRGRLSWSGVLATNPVSFSGQLDVAGLNLVTVRPYVESHINVSLTAGALAAKGAIAIDVPEGAPLKGGWKGDVVVTDFAALDKPTASDLLRWKRLELDGVVTTTSPFRLSVARIGAQDYFARAIVYQDGTLNLTRLLTPGREPEPAPDAKPAAAPAAAEREPVPITIGRIELARGNVNLSDFFVRPNYSANLTDVTGTVTTMSAEQAGDIAIAARLDRTASVEVSGRIQPFAKNLSLDVKAKASDVDLPPLTPYSVKYAGYGIDKGKLTFDVHYIVENRRLTAENRLVLDQLTFNSQHIDSATATKLPVLLAVALLKDVRGVIDIQLPIAGSLDDPTFSAGGLIIQVIVNLITKAVTAPFALLGAAFGHGEELSTIPFAPGSAAPDAQAQKRLETLAKALADRPALKLDIGGRADSNADLEALRRSSVATAMKREKMKSLAAAGTAPTSVDLVTIGVDERTRWLTAAYRESSIKDRPRNVIGLLKELPPDEMEAILLSDVKIDDDALLLLANARAQSVKDELTTRGIGGERLFLTAPRLVVERAAAAATAAPPSRVDLALR